MATNKTRFIITVDEELEKKIEDYRFNNRFPDRTKAILDLIEKGLQQVERDTAPE